MYKALLVDDERRVAENIRRMMSWDRFGIGQVKVCDNGQKALEMISLERPDVVITDIKMPLMDGIELIQRSKRAGYEAEFIVLSGYKEFELAKSVMGEGVKYYLLKPCNEEEIGASLTGAISDVESRRFHARSAAEKQQLQWLLVQHYIAMSLQNKEINEELADLIAHYTDPGGLWWIDIGWIGAIPGQAELYRSFVEWGMSHNLQVLSQMLHINDRLGCVFMSEYRDIPASALTRLQRKLGRLLQNPECMPRLCELRPDELYERMVRYCGAYNGYMRYSLQGREHVQLGQSYAEIDVELGLERLKECWSSGERERLQHVVWQLAADYDRHFVIFVFLQLLMKQLHEGRLSTSDFTERLNGIYEIKELDALSLYMTDSLFAIKSEFSSEDNFIDLILQFIDEHLADPHLKLKRLSRELVFRHEDYVARQFQKQTGETFNSYLTRKRLERAKYLIHHLGEDKIYSVAERVGLGHNPGYFSKLFKKHTGYTPKEYKQLQDS